MKDIKRIISEATTSSSRNYVQEAVNEMLGSDVKVGQTVAVVDDPIMGMSGLKGKVKKISDSNPGFAEVESQNGTLYQMQMSLLVPVV
jgi:hypothetical protein